MNPWNAEALSRRFLMTATDAERYSNECKRKLARSLRYRELHDEHLAKFCVFNYLYGKLFLKTPEAFLAEMLEFLELEQTPPHTAFDAKSFEQWRAAYIASLIAEVKAAWPALA